MFKKLEGESAILMSGGTYQVRDLYEWEGRIFAGNGSTFIQLYHDRTSKPKVQLVHCTHASKYDGYGRRIQPNAIGDYVEKVFARA